jgi:hypothetical protein
MEYKDLISLCEQTNAGKVDGDDIYTIMLRLDDLAFPEVKWDVLIELLGDIANIMYCEFGADYGSMRNWDGTVLDILETFPSGFTGSDEEIKMVFELINK